MCLSIKLCYLDDMQNSFPHSEYYDSHSHVCIPCASACLGCTGPAFTDCLQCAPGFVKNYTNDRSS